MREKRSRSRGIAGHDRGNTGHDGVESSVTFAWNTQAQRHAKRMTLYQAQDAVELRRDVVLAEVESRLGKKERREKLFFIRWALN